MGSLRIGCVVGGRTIDGILGVRVISSDSAHVQVAGSFATSQ